MRMLERCPLRKRVGAVAIHADLAVAPGLAADPVDDRPGVLHFGFPGLSPVGAEILAARGGEHADVAMSRGILRVVEVEHAITVDSEAQYRGLRSGEPPRADDVGAERRALR